MGANVCCRVRSDQVFIQEVHCHEIPFPLLINLIYRLYVQIESHTISLSTIGVFLLPARSLVCGFVVVYNDQIGRFF